MNMSEFEKKLKAIPEVEPEAEDLELLKIAGRTEYNGKISLRVPKSLHKELIEDAKKEGISLNQFILYKLAK
ncbi:MAG: toxin-antitoxin system HicB family antitoxin [Clostridia bacterium]|jgi:predicted HicB family RNase H-like nuclease|nr:toxin-antitoxin system HicB family antitoxin [Clostridia bacterium]